MNLSTLCPLPWNHFSVNLDTSMRICCNTHNGGNINHPDGSPIRLYEIENLDQYYNSDHLKKIRTQMLSGQRPEHCLNCYTNEDLGGHSLRKIYLQRFFPDVEFRKQLIQTEEDGTIVPRVQYLDFSLSNKCNLKCVMCSPTASSILKSDFDSLSWEYDEQYFRFADTGWKDEARILRTFELCLPTIEEMLFTGGEPLVAPLHIRLLEKAVETGRAKSIVLRYHSNFTNIPSRLLDIWTEFRRVDLHASIEGVGELNDYIRFGSNFATVEKNIVTVADIKNVNIEIHTCFQIPTLFRLPELHKWVSGLHPRIPPLPYHIWVNHPDWLEAYNLRDDLKPIVIELVEESLGNLPQDHHQGFVTSQFAHLRSLLKRMESRPADPKKWHEFKHRVSELEQLRGNSLKRFCPELFH